MNYRMRMLAEHRCQLRELLSDTTREQACFLVCSSAQGNDEVILLVREVVPLLEGELRVHAPDQLSVEPTAMLRVGRKARQLGGSICMVHTHPMCAGEVSFSIADDYGNQRTFEFYSRMLPGQPNSCLVWDGALECVAGRVYESSTVWHAISSVEVVSDERRRVHRERAHRAFPIDAAFDRQARLLGKEGQQALAGLRLGLCGAGGVGSVEAILAVHAGVRDFVLIDFDSVGPENMPRNIGATAEDVRIGARKTDIIRRYILAHAPEAKVAVINAPIEASEYLRDLVGLDGIVCTTDDTTSRAYLNQLSHQYYVPVLDLGVQFAADPNSGALVKEIGRCNLMLPGTPCMCCTGHVDPKRLAFEGLSRSEQEGRRQEGEGYVAGADVPEPSMMVFNMQVAALGFQRLMEWATGLRPIDVASYDAFRFLGLNGERGVKPMRKRSLPSCPFCGENAQLVGVGDAVPMLVAPRPLEVAAA